VCCSVLQLQCVALKLKDDSCYDYALEKRREGKGASTAMCYSVLQCVAVRCGVLQYVAVRVWKRRSDINSVFFKFNLLVGVTFF